MDGKTDHVRVAGHIKPEYRDEYASEILPQALVEEALIHEVN